MRSESGRFRRDPTHPERHTHTVSVRFELATEVIFQLDGAFLFSLLKHYPVFMENMFFCGDSKCDVGNSRSSAVLRRSGVFFEADGGETFKPHGATSRGHCRDDPPSEGCFCALFFFWESDNYDQ